MTTAKYSSRLRVGLAGAALALSCALGAFVFAPGLARSADEEAGEGGAAVEATGAARVATARPRDIFQQAAEAKAHNDELAAEDDRLVAEQKERAGAIKEMEQALGRLKPGAPQFEKMRGEFIKANMEYEVWLNFSRREFERQMMRQSHQMMEKIWRTIGQVAQEKGIDLVLADQWQELPDNVIDGAKPEQLNALMAQRAILYSSEVTDITNDVIDRLNDDFKRAKAKGKKKGGDKKAKRPRQPRDEAEGDAADNGGGGGDEE